MAGREPFDILVVGGGMVGATAAALFGRIGLSVLMIDGGSEPAWDASQPVGLRVSAISPGSAAILDAAGAWPAISSERVCPYHRMHVEDGQGTGQLDFEAAGFGFDWLGSIVENDLITRSLWDTLATLPDVEVRSEVRLESLVQDGREVSAELSTGENIRARLLLACDGAASPVRKLLGVGGDAWEYNQLGVVGRVKKQQPNPGVAWQRFLPGGPLALLPLKSGWSSMVWSLPVAEAKAMLAMSDEEFAEALDMASSGFLGSVEALGPRAAFPLAMGLSDHYVVGRTVLLGDAAHVVHPLAGQGVNLGLADVAALVESIGNNPSPDDRVLEQWERWRRSEISLMAGGVHALGGLFRPQLLALPRGLGMKLVNRSWTLREAFLRRAAGQGPNSPKLARGESLEQLLQRRSP